MTAITPSRRGHIWPPRQRQHYALSHMTAPNRGPASKSNRHYRTKQINFGDPITTEVAVPIPDAILSRSALRSCRPGRSAFDIGLHQDSQHGFDHGLRLIGGALTRPIRVGHRPGHQAAGNTSAVRSGARPPTAARDTRGLLTMPLSSSNSQTANVPDRFPALHGCYMVAGALCGLEQST